MISRLLGLFFIVYLSACSSDKHYAPVMDVASIEPVPSSGQHHVVHGETLYEIAWRYGLDYRTVANKNRLNSPYVLYSGQKLNLHKPMPTKSSPSVIAPTMPSEGGNLAFLWPLRGKIVKAYSASNKGLDIAQLPGTPILASESGTVVYAGNGLRGYGNLIIIKHNNEYLSAYAQTQRMQVTEGSSVRRGQKIAEISKSARGKSILHFEIRKAGQPVDPLLLLGS